MTQSESGALARRGSAPAWVSIALQAAEWACVLASVGLWATERPPEGLVLLAGPLWLAAWAWRWLRLGKPTRAAALDWPMWAFLATALVGLWAAPIRGAGLARLDLFLGAVGIYYLLANSPKGGRELFLVGGGCAPGWPPGPTQRWATGLAHHLAGLAVLIQSRGRCSLAGATHYHSTIVWVMIRL